MATVYINGQPLDVADDQPLNGIEAARRTGVDVPHYCWHPGLSVVASCRMCLVETGRRDAGTGEITMLPKLVPACQTPATDGTVFVTDSEKVISARQMVEEDLLIRHPIDCPICDKAGECNLQDYHFEHGRPSRRADIKPFTSRRRPLGDSVTLFVDRCVMCSRCVRFCREIAGTRELMVVNRGAHEEIDVFPGFPLQNKMAGNVVDLCPVGALGDVDFLYSQRVWFMRKHEGVCAGCSTGCSIEIEENQDRIYRLKPRENPHINHWWMCDDGRYGFEYVHRPDRITQPRVRQNDGWQDVHWSHLPQQLDERLKKAGRLAAVISPFLTVEEAYLLGSYALQVDPDAALVVGPAPQDGDDEQFPNGFTIRAEKCPNRRGVEAIVERLAGTLVSFDDFLRQSPSELPNAIWVTGAYPEAWISQDAADRLSEIPLIVVQDLFASPLWELATIQLPTVSFAERQGSYVNHADRLQSFDWAIRPPAGAISEGQLCWRLLGRGGLFNARQVMEQIGREIAYFAPATGPVPSSGVDLRVNLLAGSEIGASG